MLHNATPSTIYASSNYCSYAGSKERLLRYLAGNPKQGISLATRAVVNLKAYCGGGWANCPITRRSTTDYYIFFGSSPISWNTKKQSVVAISSAKAKYRAMAITTYEGTWLSALLKDSGIKNLPPDYASL